MRNPPIILGKVETILCLPKAPLKNPGYWTQMDSDILAHFLQVDSQIRTSRWYKSKIQYSEQGGKHLESEFPDFEDFVFAAVYFRQLIAEKDGLLDDAVSRYCKFVDCQSRPSWVRHEVKMFDGSLKSYSFPAIGYTVREVFDAFIYGAGLMHSFRAVTKSNRERFLKMFDNLPRPKLLYCLNGSLLLLTNQVANVAAVIHRDFSHWLHDYNLPLPDTRWHNRLFDVS